MEKQQIFERYNEFILENGRRPENVYKFSKEIGIAESEFYKEFGSFDAIEMIFFSELFNKTIETLNNDQNYSSYDSKTRLLSFYYTFFENLAANRSIVFHFLSPDKWHLMTSKKLTGLGQLFKEYINGLGIESLNIPQERFDQLKNKTIAELAWAQLLLTIKFWMEDNSASFEKTDIFIEKSLQASFDLVTLAPFKNLIDLGKFLFKEKARV